MFRDPGLCPQGFCVGCDMSWDPLQGFAEGVKLFRFVPYVGQQTLFINN